MGSSYGILSRSTVIMFMFLLTIHMISALDDAMTLIRGESNFADDSKRSDEVTDEYVAKINGDVETARTVGVKHGFSLKRQLTNLDGPNMYLYTRSTRHKREASEHTKRLSDDSRVEWSEHQHVKSRRKRDNSEFKAEFNDPLWSSQWYLHDLRVNQSDPKLDLHVIGSWKQGYTGKGVSVTILDDGLEWDHDDIRQNFDPYASYDLNDDDSDPMPTKNNYNRHGTRCAGEVAMEANNGKCGVGIAYESRIGAIRMLDGKITDRLEMEALQFNISHIDIYSASWGPNDDGKTVEGPGKLASGAILNGIKRGRKGKGVIYVWASGNGGGYEDDCNCDGYTDSIYTLSVSSASKEGTFPWYGEQCPSTMATTYSSGSYNNNKISTIDLNNDCTTQHSGTSAAAPLAAGIIALGLQANSNLTWRDVQHITAWTSEPYALQHNPDWQTNGVGLRVNNRFGFGLMNAKAFTETAATWTNVQEQRTCVCVMPQRSQHKRAISGESSAKLKFYSDGCEQTPESEIRYLEHIQLVVDIEYSKRGNLQIILTSPQGTRTRLLNSRTRDQSTDGFKKWPFMSVHSWGENPKGYWDIEVIDVTGANSTKSNSGALTNVTLIQYGTLEMPHHYRTGRRLNLNYNEVHDRSVGNQRSKRID